MYFIVSAAKNEKLADIGTSVLSATAALTTSLHASFAGECSPAQAAAKSTGFLAIWDEAGRNKRTGVYRGKEAILEHAMQLAVLTDGTLATTVKEILPGEDHVAVRERVTAKRSGRVLDMDCCSVYTLRNGKDRRTPRAAI